MLPLGGDNDVPVVAVALEFALSHAVKLDGHEPHLADGDVKPVRPRKGFDYFFGTTLFAALSLDLACSALPTRLP